MKSLNQIHIKDTFMPEDEKVQDILCSHGIKYRTDNGLEVLEESTLNGVYSSEWINASEWSLPELMAWLGY